MSRANAIYLTSLLVTCVTLLVAPSFAQILGGAERVPGTDCFGPLRGIDGCVGAVTSSLVSAQIWAIDKTCCQAFLDVDYKCWSQILPLKSFYPTLVKDYCMTQVEAPSPAPAATDHYADHPI
ncbi:hypothetical protein U1Q18_036587 [Sarracenia purpurea var. burkii]